MMSDLKFYLRLGWKRLPLILACLIVAVGVGIWLTMTLPKLYTSSARLLVEAPQIPDELASSTVQVGAAEQLAVIQQRLLTRANLLAVARRHEALAGMGGMTPDEIVEEMLRRTTFSTSSSSRTDPNGATVTTIAFDARTAQIAANVANDYVTSVLEQNVQQRTSTAEDTFAFFQQEVERLSTELDKRSAEIIEFQNQNITALPDGQSYRQSQLSGLQERLDQLRREIAQIETQRENLIDLYESTGGVGFGEEATPEERRLAAAEDELSQAQLVYSESNPRVRLLKAEVDRLRKRIAANSGEVSGGGTGNATLDGQLVQLDTRKSFLEDQIGPIETQMAQLEEAIQKTPANGVTLDSLRRDYENVQLQYNQAQSRLAQAATGERIELSSKGQRISVIEQPTVPSEPSKPDPVMVLGMSGGLGLAVGLGLLVLLELLNDTLRRPSDLEKALGIRPLGTIPYITTRREIVLRRTARLAMLAVFVVGCSLGLYLVHTRYMPLDLVWDQVQTRLSL